MSKKARQKKIVGSAPPAKAVHVPMITRAQLMEHVVPAMELVGPHLIDMGINAASALILIAREIAYRSLGNREIPQADIVIIAVSVNFLWSLDEFIPPMNYPYTHEQTQAAMGISPNPEADVRGKQMMKLRMMPYDKYLKTSHWAKKRQAALERAGFRCQICNAGDVRLTVHHRTYASLGFEADQDLTVLCDECHGIFHGHGKLAERGARHE